MFSGLMREASSIHSSVMMLPPAPEQMGGGTQEISQKPRCLIPSEETSGGSSSYHVGTKRKV